MSFQQTLKNYVINEFEPPTYLKHFDKGDKNIILVHVKQRKQEVDEGDSIELTDLITNNITLEKLDLTGNPLQLDLHSDLENHDVTIISNTPKSWLKSETLHFPLSLVDCIGFMRHYGENNCQIGDGLGSKIYGVCDGLDVAKTILIGSQQSDVSLNTFELNFRGCFAQDDVDINMTSMEKEHLEEVGEDVKVTCTIISNYALNGFDLKLLNNLNDSNNYGALLMDVLWKDGTGFNSDTSNISSAKLHIQTIAGHRASPIANLWEDLLLIEKLINLLNIPSDNLDEVILSERFFDYPDIIKQIEESLQSFSPFRKMRLEEKVKITNFENFRPYNGIDCFWNILKRCKEVDDVRSIFHSIFTEAARDKSLHINIPLNNNGFFANMLRGILEGTHAVPTFTAIKSLECLIEFGIAKLKNDYLFILDTYNCDTQNPAFEIFSINCDEVPDNRRTVNKRRTVRYNNDNRLTVNRHRMTVYDLNSTEIDIGLYKKQLHLLSGLHMSIQSILLLKDKLYRDMDLPSDAFYHTPQYVLDHFLGPNRSATSFNDLIRNNLCELSLDVNDIDKKILPEYEILHWKYCFKSVNYKTTITSIYLHSVMPIFPPCIVKNYECPEETEDVYHVSRFLSIEDAF